MRACNVLCVLHTPHGHIMYVYIIYLCACEVCLVHACMCGKNTQGNKFMYYIHTTSSFN